MLQSNIKMFRKENRVTTARTRAFSKQRPVFSARPWFGVPIAIAFAAALLLLSACSAQGDPDPTAVRGVLDLSSWDFSSRGPVNLAGEWEFYWSRLLSPADFAGKQSPGIAGYLTMPAFWNNRFVAGTKLPGRGFATMRLRVFLGDRRGFLALRVPHMYTAYRLWVNGRPVSSNGTPGTDAAHEIPRFLTRTVILASESDTLELLVQVSNFHHPRGGMWSSIQLGKDLQIVQLQRHRFGINSFIFGGLLLMSLYHMGIFLLRRTDRASLFFSLFCLSMAIRIPFEGDRLLIEFLPWISWEINEKISYLTFYSSVCIVNLYLYYLFPDIYSRALVKVITAMGIAFCCAILVLTSRYYFYTRYPYYGILAISMVYNAYVIVRAAVMKKEGAAYLVVGMLILLAMVMIDVLNHDRIIGTMINVGNFSSLGVLIFTISQAMHLSERSSKAYTRIETLSTEKARLFASSINIISSILLASSTRLYEYTQNVARISVMLARRVGIPDDTVEDIRIAALLHDIGMVGIADEIPCGPEHISDAEKLIIENHPLKSNEIIASLTELGRVKSIIAQHHERFDGSGYPLRIAGRDIDIGARIIGLVDDFVAMLGRREFQSEDKKTMIIEELERRKETLYDPSLVEALIRLIDKERLVYNINEQDIRYEKMGDVARWAFPSNVNYEISVLKKVIEEVRSRAAIDEDTLHLIETGLGEIIRNAIIHGNKYDETKQVTVTCGVRSRGNGKVLEFRVADQGAGMDFARYNHFKDGRLKLYDITRELRQQMPALEKTGAKEVLANLNKKLQSFLMDYYINYNKFRRIDSPETTGGIGLFLVMQTFNTVDFRAIVENHALCGMEVVLEKYIDG
ncbi:MAG: ATP-binding protein [Spirochaetes bacterium]|nr:ATP-binding protein [Spirochaetota bacterium]